jgi:hypothetical protein
MDMEHEKTLEEKTSNYNVDVCHSYVQNLHPITSTPGLTQLNPCPYGTSIS